MNRETVPRLTKGAWRVPTSTALTVALVLGGIPTPALAEALGGSADALTASASANIAEGEVGTCVWSVDDAGVLTISPAAGEEAGEIWAYFTSSDITWPWRDTSTYPGLSSKVKSVRFSPGVKARDSIYGLFQNMESVDLSGFDTSAATNMGRLFYNYKGETLDLSGLQTQNVTTMRYMFYGASNLVTLDLSSFDTSQVTAMTQMFYKCKALQSINLSGVDNGKVTKSSNMFSNCTSLTTIYTDGTFDLSKPFSNGTGDIEVIDVREQEGPAPATGLEQYAAEVREAQAAVDDAYEAYEKALAEAGGTDVASAKEQLEEAQKQLADAQAALSEAQEKQAEAQEALEGSQSAEAAAQEALTKAQQRVVEVEEAVETAQQKLDEAEAAKEDADATWAKVGDDEARAAMLAEAEAKVADAERQRDAAEAAYELAVKDRDEAEKARDEAQQRATELAAPVREAEEALDAAKADAAVIEGEKEAREAIAAAQDAYKEANEENENAKKQVAASEANKTTADASKTAADNDVSTKKALLEKAAEALANAVSTVWDLSKYNTARGSLGFFEYVGADTCVGELTGTDYKYMDGNYEETKTPTSLKTGYKNQTHLSYTNIGADGDATSLDNMKTAIEWIMECNRCRNEYNTIYGLTTPGQTMTDEYGASHKYLEPFNVTDWAMMVAQISANESAQMVDHTDNTFSTAENLAWASSENGRNPFDSWFWGEKETADRWNKQYAETGEWDGIGQIGHYQNLLTSASTHDTGFAVTYYADYDLYARHRTYPWTYCQEFAGVDSQRIYKSSAYTVDEYYTRFMNYYNAVKAAESGSDQSPEQIAYDTAKTAYDNAVDKQQTAAKDLADAQDALKAAETEAADAAKAFATAEANLNKVVSDNPVSDLDAEAVAANLDAAQKAYDDAIAEKEEADGDLASAVTTLGEREGAVSDAEAAQSSARADYDKALADQKALVESLGEASGIDKEAAKAAKEATDEAYEAARDALRNAQDAQKTAQEGFEGAQKTLGEAQAAVTRAEDEVAAQKAAVASAEQEVARLTERVGQAQSDLAQAQENDRALSDARSVLEEAQARLASAQDAAAQAADLGNATVGAVSPRVYDGTPYEPSFDVQANGTTLAQGTDYTVTYHNNVDAGTAYATLEGRGSYVGKKYVEYLINCVDIADAQVDGIVDATYTGEAITQDIVVTCGGATLAAGVDYDVSYLSNVAPGTATVVVSGRGNYAGSLTREFTIENAPEPPAPEFPETKPEEQLGEDGTAVGPGASEEAAERAITQSTSDADPKGSKFGLLQARATKVAKTSLRIGWKKVGGAKRYVVYANRCGQRGYKRLATTSKTSYVAKKVAGKKVAKGTYYKFLVVAVDARGKVVSTSKTIHVATVGGKVGNAKAVKTAARGGKVTLKKGKTFKLKARVVAKSAKLKIRKHRAVKYETSNAKVATVSAKGVVKARGKGTCYVYAYAQDGTCARVKVTVR